jgi:TatD family hydrolase
LSASGKCPPDLLETNLNSPVIMASSCCYYFSSSHTTQFASAYKRNNNHHSDRLVRFERAASGSKARRFHSPRASSFASSREEEEENSCTLDAKQYAFVGTEKLYGASNLTKLRNAHVVVVGIGGIGSWVAEALARTSIGEFTLIDLDFICVTNINRQAMAAESTVGESKALAMKRRILDLNKDAKVNCVEDFVNKENVEEILKPLVGCGEGRKVEYVVDCTDNEQDKAAIIAYCVKHNVPVMTTGGAAGMTNFPPSGVAVEDLQKATFNRLLASARKTLRDKYAFPRGVKKFPNGKRMKSDDVVAGDGKKPETFKERKFKVIAVYAKELNENFAVKNSSASSSDSVGGVPSGGKINCADGSSGSAAFVTGAIGLAAASKVVVDVLARTDAQREKIGQPFKSGWQSKVWTSSDGGGGGGGEDAQARKADESTENKTDEAKTIPTPMGNQIQVDDESLTEFIGEDVLRDASKDNLNLNEIFDAHCHWHLHSDDSEIEALGKEVYKMALTCTQPSDWQKALKISKTLNYPIALGAHPWWIHENKSTFHAWIEELETLASATPLSIIGEIGLDKIAVPLDGVTPPDYPFQLEAFTKQLELARKLNKPIAVHCVKATSDIQSALFESKQMPRAVLLHSYSGSSEWMRQLVEMKQNKGEHVYFGFSSVVNLRGWKKTLENIRKCPADRIVVESDLVSCENVENELRKIVAFIAKAKGWSVKETARITRENADRLYGCLL